MDLCRAKSRRKSVRNKFGYSHRNSGTSTVLVGTTYVAGISEAVPEFPELALLPRARRFADG